MLQPEGGQSGGDGRFLLLRAADGQAAVECSFSLHRQLGEVDSRRGLPELRRPQAISRLQRWQSPGGQGESIRPPTAGKEPDKHRWLAFEELGRVREAGRAANGL